MPDGNIHQLWAWLAVEGDEEGVIAVKDTDGDLRPLVCSSQRLVEKMRPVVQEIVDAEGITARLVRFDSRTDLESLGPDKSHRPLFTDGPVIRA